MCVVFICETVRPTADMVEKAFFTNNAGGGVAWRLDKKTVKWQKGLDVDEMTNLIAEVPFPFIAHFRIPSSGGKSPWLCHPFPIERDTKLLLEGTTGGNVLFHNGHWKDWKEDAKLAAVRSNTPLPPGRWTDTRAMAFVASIYGLGVLEMIDEKTVAFGPNTLEVCAGAGWFEIEVTGTGKKFWASNKYWESVQGGFWKDGRFCIDGEGGCSGDNYYTRPPASIINGNKVDIDKIQTAAEKARGTSPAETFCGSGTIVEGGKTQQQQVEEGKACVGGVSGPPASGGDQEVKGLIAAPSEDDLAKWRWAAGINNKKHLGPLKGKVGFGLQLPDKVM